MARRGHEVAVITGLPHYPAWRVEPPYRGRAWHRETRGGVSIYRVPVILPRSGRVTTTGRLGLETSFAALSWRWWLPQFLRHRSADVIVAVIPPLQDAHIPLLVGRLKGIPVLLHVQDLQVDAALNLGMLPSSVSALLRRWESSVLRAADQVTTITEEMRSRIIAKGVDPERTMVVPNWADTGFRQAGPTGCSPSARNSAPSTTRSLPCTPAASATSRALRPSWRPLASCSLRASSHSPSSARARRRDA